MMKSFSDKPTFTRSQQSCSGVHDYLGGKSNPGIGPTEMRGAKATYSGRRPVVL
jgi:hypothetical protein